MAGISTDGGKKGRRALDSEINMIPMIDLLMVTVSFLLITAVWVHSSRLDSTAQVPGPTSQPCEGDCKEETRLHVQTNDPTKFVLAWKQGATVVRSVDVPRSYPELAQTIDAEWRTSGMHRDPADKKLDHAVVHAANDLQYKDIIAVMDAVAKPTRAVVVGKKTAQTAAFDVTFAVD